MCQTLRTKRVLVFDAAKSARVHAVLKADRKASVTEPVSKRPSTAQFRTMLTQLRGRVQEVSERLERGEIDPRSWAEAFHQILTEGHSLGWMMGRQRSGNLGGLTFDDVMHGVAVTDADADFLLGFLDDLINGRYTSDDGVLTVPVWRTDLYLHKIRGTANQAFAEVSELDDAFAWELGGAEEHCPDCPELAAASPWDLSTLFAFPGDCTTKCKSNCKCFLVRLRDGISGFKSVEF